METIKKILRIVYKSKRNCIDCSYFGVNENKHCKGCNSQKFTPSDAFIESFANEIMSEIKK